MLRTLHRIMKGHGLVAGLLLFLTVGFVFPTLHSFHEHGAVVTVHHHNYADDLTAGEPHGVGEALLAHAWHHQHGDHHSNPAQCNDECCAPSCCALSVVAEVESHSAYFEAERFFRLQDRHLNGVTPLTAERPPRA